MSSDCSRRGFLKSGALLTMLGAWPGFAQGIPGAALASAAHRPRKAARIRGAFFYPPADVVLSGNCEDSWAAHQWFTWPGNQFKPEEQQASFLTALERIGRGLNLELALDDAPIYTDAAIAAFAAEMQSNPPDALLLFNFWNSFSAKILPILDAFPGPVILYHPLGASHQLPPERFRTDPRIQYIHSIEHFEALENGLRAVHARTLMAQSRVLRVSGKIDQEQDDVEPFFKTAVHAVPASHFNDLYDSLEEDDVLREAAAAFRAGAQNTIDLSDQSFMDAARAHAAVKELMRRQEADAITIECLFLKHRKPCLSFATNNGALVPCGCENDLNATLSLMLGTSLFDRPGFQHNPEFDTVENHYFASHCTCTPHLHGMDQPPATYDFRPFFHQMPKTPALDVQWPPDEPVTLFKYQADGPLLHAWEGRVLSSPQCPPTGGCATRVLVEMRGVEDICTIYPGPHPTLFCGHFAKRVKTFAKLSQMEIRTNA